MFYDTNWKKYGRFLFHGTKSGGKVKISLEEL
jgi:hypothetical protein